MTQIRQIWTRVLTKKRHKHHMRKVSRPPSLKYFTSLLSEDAEPLNSDDDVSDSNDNEIFETGKFPI